MPSFFVDIVRYLAAYPRWIGSFGRIWVALAAVCIAVALSALIPAKAEDQIRYSGLMLQLLGVGTVVALLRDKAEAFGRLGLIGYLRERFAARPRFRPTSHTIALSGVASASAAGSAHLSMWRNPDAAATVENRLAMLEGNAETLRQDLAWHSQQARQVSGQLEAELNAERKERLSTVGAVEQRLDKFGAGGLHVEASGLFWLILGIILATIPLEVAKLLGLAQ